MQRRCSRSLNFPTYHHSLGYAPDRLLLALALDDPAQLRSALFRYLPTSDYFEMRWKNYVHDPRSNQ